MLFYIMKMHQKKSYVWYEFLFIFIKHYNLVYLLHKNDTRWGLLSIDRLSIVWKSNQSDKIKHDFFQAMIVSVLLNRCTTWTLLKHIEKKPDGNGIKCYEITAVQPLIFHLKVRQTRHVEHYWRSKGECIIYIFLRTLSHWRASIGWPARTDQ